jgi:hypothetical protein
VRNNHTLAHDNPELINKEEAYFYLSKRRRIRALPPFR